MCYPRKPYLTVPSGPLIYSVTDHRVTPHSIAIPLDYDHLPALRYFITHIYARAIKCHVYTAHEYTRATHVRNLRS